MRRKGTTVRGAHNPLASTIATAMIEAAPRHAEAPRGDVGCQRPFDRRPTCKGGWSIPGSRGAGVPGAPAGDACPADEPVIVKVAAPNCHRHRLAAPASDDQPAAPRPAATSRPLIATGTTSSTARARFPARHAAILRPVRWPGMSRPSWHDNEKPSWRVARHVVPAWCIKASRGAINKWPRMRDGSSATGVVPLPRRASRTGARVRPAMMATGEPRRDVVVHPRSIAAVAWRASAWLARHRERSMLPTTSGSRGLAMDRGTTRTGLDPGGHHESKKEKNLACAVTRWRA
ncbi:MAG: hypothetical protein GYA24_24470 [Candidatus Lokiarchaeota archaeon]|nr:hypothetical protein [Candidatus Lokiarchaeota archaeon]